MTQWWVIILLFSWNMNLCLSSGSGVLIIVYFVCIIFPGCWSLSFSTMKWSVASDFALVSPGVWLLSFRPMKASVASASTLFGILNVFVSEQNIWARTTRRCELTTYNYNYEKMAGESSFRSYLLHELTQHFPRNTHQ